jgi:hypothetical protein
MKDGDDWDKPAHGRENDRGQLAALTLRAASRAFAGLRIGRAALATASIAGPRPRAKLNRFRG